MKDFDLVQSILKILSNKDLQSILMLSVCISILYIIQYLVRLYLAKRKANNSKGLLIQIIPPKYTNNQFVDDRGFRFSLQRFFDDIVASVKDERVSFEIHGDRNGIKFLIWSPNLNVQNLIKSQLYITYNERIKIKSIGEDPFNSFNNSYSIVEEYKPRKHEAYMLMDVKDFNALDPVDNIIGSMVDLDDNEKMVFQMVLKPSKIDTKTLELAKQNFRLRKGELTWQSLFLSNPLAYIVYFIPLFPVMILKIISAFSSELGRTGKILDQTQLLPDSDPRKVFVDQDAMSDYNSRMQEKERTTYISYIRVGAIGNKIAMKRKLDSLESALVAMKTEKQNTLVRVRNGNINNLKTRFLYPEDDVNSFIKYMFTSQRSMSSREISMLYHLPSEIFNPKVDHFTLPDIPYKAEEGQLSKNFDPTSQLLLGNNVYRGKNLPVYLDNTKRARHVVVTGQTGTGKSTILKNMILQDIDNRFLRGVKRGLFLMDPHEDFFMDILHKLPVNIDIGKSLIPWDTRSEEYYIGFNPLYSIGMSQREIEMTVDSNYKLIEKMIEKKNPDKGMGVTAEPMLFGAMETLMIFQNEWLKRYPDHRETMEKFAPTFTDLRYIFQGDEMQNTLLNFIDVTKYENIRAFWETILPAYKESKTWPEIHQGFLNKVGQIISKSLLYTFGQSKSTINLSDVIRNSKVMLVNLSSKNLGEEGMSLLGSFFMAKLWFEVKRIEEKDRRPFAVYADEFQNFASRDFASVLSEARKFKLELVLAHQFLDQLPEYVKAAINGNVKTRIIYRSGSHDAEEFFKEMQDKILMKEIMEVPDFNAICRIESSLSTIQISKERDNNFTDSYVNNLVEEAYLRYGKTKQEIEDDITKRRNWYLEGCPETY